MQMNSSYTPETHMPQFRLMLVPYYAEGQVVRAGSHSHPFKMDALAELLVKLVVCVALEAGFPFAQWSPTCWD